MPDPSPIEVECQPDRVVIRVLRDHLDDSNMDAVRKSIETAGKQSPQLPLFLDMSMVYFMVSLSLGEFVELSQQFKGRGQRLVLMNLQAPVRQVIAITRLDKLFEIQEDRPQAET
ncbi:MAG TPA: STAS domain-containing protein [Phycisphaerae bacterium]|nr:STAS domain-containing protein [Phycisphaerae bacterium]